MPAKTNAGYVVHVWRVCKANPGQPIGPRDVDRLTRAKLADWTDRGTLTTDALLHRLRVMMYARINRNVPHAGRKADPGYQVRLRRDARRVRDRVQSRVTVRQFETAEVRNRLSHLLTVD